MEYYNSTIKKKKKKLFVGVVAHNSYNNYYCWKIGLVMLTLIGLSIVGFNWSDVDHEIGFITPYVIFLGIIVYART